MLVGQGGADEVALDVDVELTFIEVPLVLELSMLLPDERGIELVVPVADMLLELLLDMLPLEDMEGEPEDDVEPVTELEAELVDTEFVLVAGGMV